MYCKSDLANITVVKPSISRNSFLEKYPRILRTSGYDGPAESVNRAGQDVQFSRHEVNRRPIRRCPAGKANREQIRTDDDVRDKDIRPGILGSR